MSTIFFERLCLGDSEKVYKASQNFILAPKFKIQILTKIRNCFEVAPNNSGPNRDRALNQVAYERRLDGKMVGY